MDTTAPRLTVAALADRLLALLPALADDEGAVVEAHASVVLARRDLANAEMHAWDQDLVEGSNAEKRATSLRKQTLQEIIEVERAEGRLRRAQSTLRVHEQEARSLRAIIPALDTRLIVTERE
jgi:hypothetical protein